MRLVRPLSVRDSIFLAALLASANFLFDLSQPLGVAVGIPYVGLPLLGLLARSPRLIVIFAGAGTGLIVAGTLLSISGTPLQYVLLNRGMSIILVWVVALIAIRHLAIGDQLRESLKKQVSEDPLTGLFNRRHVFNIIQHELNRYRRYREPLALILIDADHFKRVNDSWGHCTGDLVLKRIAEVCRHSVRESDVVGRFGGEEFIIALPQTSAVDAAIVAQRIHRSMRKSAISVDGNEITVTLSLGVAECGPEADTFDDLLRAADRALYRAKRTGRDRISLAHARPAQSSPESPESPRAA